MKISILGTGAFGMALASIFYNNKCNIKMWTNSEDEKDMLIKNRKSAADERLALSVTQRNEPTTLGSMGGSFLFYVDEDLNDQSCGHDD